MGQSQPLRHKTRATAHSNIQIKISPFFLCLFSHKTLNQKSNKLKKANIWSKCNLKQRADLMKWHIGITIDREVFKEIENLRGMTKRSTFMQHLLELGIKEYKKQQKTQKTTTEPIVDVEL
jgi:hypothetical protein